jgi:DNA-binding transcriptional LysR family regulator
MSIDLRWLRSFLAVAEELNFSRAARKLHLAQPALTAHIKQLENAVEAQLFDRTNRISGLTPAGNALLEEAEAMVSRADSLRQIARRAKDGETGRLRVGLIPPAAIRPVAEAARRFTKKFPEVEVTVRQGGQDRLLEHLTDGDLDLVLGRPLEVARATPIRGRRLMIEEQGIVLRDDDPLSRSAVVPLRGLHGRPLLLLRGNLHFGQNIMELAARERVELTPKAAAEDFSSLHWMVRAGLGVAPCSLLLGDSLPQGLVVRPLFPAPAKLPIHALWTGEQATSCATHLMEILTSAIRADCGSS